MFDQNHSPSPAAHKPVRTHVPGQLVPKLIFLVVSVLLCLCGSAYLWQPLGRMLHGRTVDARVAEIRVSEPGQSEVIYNYRREHKPVNNLAITFAHYVAIDIDGRTELFHLSVDSRRKPADGCNVNDIVRVAYYPGDPTRVAFAIGQARTWGAATILCGVSGFMLFIAIPMVLTARRPIVIDPESAPSTDGGKPAS